MIYCHSCKENKNIDDWDEEFLECGHRLCTPCQETHDDYRDCPENTPTARDEKAPSDFFKEADRRPDPGMYGKWKRSTAISPNSRFKY